MSEDTRQARLDPENGLPTDTAQKFQSTHFDSEDLGTSVQEQGTLEKFFGGHWNTWVYKLRYLIITVMMGWSIFAIIMASGIKPLSEPE